MPRNAKAETPAAKAAAIMRAAAQAGVTVTARLTRNYNPATGQHDGPVASAVVSAVMTFPPGDAQAFALAESACNEVLRLVPVVRQGSVWGTDSHSAGGHAGLTEGWCQISKSGVAVRVAAFLAG